MMFFIALSMSITAAGAFLLYQFRARAFADDQAAPDEHGDDGIEEQQAA